MNQHKNVNKLNKKRPNKKTMLLIAAPILLISLFPVKRTGCRVVNYTCMAAPVQNECARGSGTYYTPLIFAKFFTNHTINYAYLGDRCDRKN